MCLKRFPRAVDNPFVKITGLYSYSIFIFLSELFSKMPVYTRKNTNTTPQSASRVGVTITCNSCLEKDTLIAALTKKNDDLCRVIEAQNGRIDELIKRVGSLESAQSAPANPRSDAEMMNRLNALESRFANFTHSFPMRVADALSEVEQKKEKRNNLVLVGVKEDNGEDLKDLAITIGKEIDANVDWDAAISGAKRNGKPQKDKNGKDLPRIIKLYFNDKDARKAFLKNYKNTISLDSFEGFSRSFCRIDMTYNERMLDKKLRAEVKSRAENGDTSWVVRNFDIVRKSKSSPRHSISHGDE